MSFLGTSGGSSSAGRTYPLTAPTASTLINATDGIPLSTPTFQHTATYSSQTGSKKNIVEGYKIYRTSDNLLMRTVYGVTTTNHNTLVMGTQYYSKAYITDTVQGLEAYSAASANKTAISLPANMGSITASSSISLVNFSWTAPNNGGDSSMYYDFILYANGIQRTAGTLAVGALSFSYSTAETSVYFSLRVTPHNAVGTSGSTLSSAVNPQQYVPPYFPPYFGCIEAETPIMVLVDGNKLYKKAKDIKVGDILVSYSFDELPESEFDYSIDTWNHESLTPKKPESADVVSVQELITKATMYLNKDINTRMSLEHSVFVKRDGNYSIIASGLIEVGDIVVQINPETMELSEISVDYIDYIDEESKIYKIDCKPYDVFFAGNILTHNRKKFY